VRRLLGILALAAVTLAPRARAQRVAEVQVAPRFVRMRVDAQTSVLATAFDADGNPVRAVFHWWSSNINVVQVSPEGVIRAVAPGVAVVAAAVDSGPRRRIGQTTVFVQRPGSEPGPPGAVTIPEPPTMPRVYVMPMAPGKPGMNMDSIIRSSFNCADPYVNALNPAHACWDERARPLARPAAPVPEACGDEVTPATLMLRVSDAGAVLDVRLFAPSRCPAFTEAATAQVREFSFSPAQRGGQAVEAWTLLRVIPLRSR
jgi:hypothetical protein